MTASYEDYSSLRRNVSFLGGLLGEVIAEAEGDDCLALVERIRLLSRDACEGDADAQRALLDVLVNLPDRETVPVARAFSQFLNLANIAEQRHTVSRAMDPLLSASKTLHVEFEALLARGIAGAEIQAAVEALNIELVLTAHPTEITRRTLIHKHAQISECLGQLELEGRTERERAQIHARLRDLITQVWHSHEFRQQRPTPVDEARWGFAVVEESLWRAVPEFVRRLDTQLLNHCGVSLPLTAAPVRFLSWMGGDRDGNPNVTAEVTREVLLLSRWQAASLYLRDVRQLVDELSMTICDDALRKVAGDAFEPYRAVLRPLRTLLGNTLRTIEQQLDGEPVADVDVLTDPEQLWQPLHACYQSLLNCGLASVANRDLLDVLRRVRCFGVHLLRHDVRQDSACHTEALSEITQYLGLGDYAQWDEQQRQAFLLAELVSKRPLIPDNWQPSANVQEVLDTCKVVANTEREAFGAYVISMARQASDVLAVHLLLKACACPYYLPVAPLFETLDDLERASAVMQALFANEWYRSQIGHAQMVMIGYSDSSKDAGVIAASWAQYRAQEALLALCEREGIALTLFHGRGGTIGRGGAPARDALLSQPPGSLRTGLRVTEQGEMIRAKLGLSSLATKTLALYASAILRANLINPPTPKQAWQDVMDKLAEESCTAYRNVVRGEADFVAYFRYATPEQELAKLPLGSRPARRKSGGGIGSLRAIPWIFAWMQNRLMLPAWLGAGEALQASIDRGEKEILLEMVREWPFFASRLSMQNMVFAKADTALSAYYDQRLVPGELRPIGVALREQMQRDRQTLLQLLPQRELTPAEEWAQESIRLRAIYTDPINYLQVELLQRERNNKTSAFDDAIMVTIAGVAAGMRNTG